MQQRMQEQAREIERLRVDNEALRTADAAAAARSAQLQARLERLEFLVAAPKPGGRR
jgi:hypothetical protein